MRVYVFGNPDDLTDNAAIVYAQQLANDFPSLPILIIKPNEDFPETKDMVIILDVVDGLDDVAELTIDDIDKLVLSPRSTVHDYDLNFQLKYLKKLDKLGNVVIVGIPMGKSVPYLRIQEIFKKLVAQDIQGS